MLVGFFNRFRELPHSNRAVDHIVDDLRHALGTQRGYGSPIRNLGLSGSDPQDSAARAAERVLNDVLMNVLYFVPALKEPSLRTLERTADLVIPIELMGTVEGFEKPLRFLLSYHQVPGAIFVEVWREE